MSRAVGGVDSRRWPAAGLLAAGIVLLAGCTTVPAPAPRPPGVRAPVTAPPAVRTTTVARYERVPFAALPEMSDGDLAAALPALRASCGAFERVPARRDAWRPLCDGLAALPADGLAVRAHLSARVDVYRMLADAADEPATRAVEARPETVARGRITGYYEPLLRGSRSPRAPFTVPLHRPPADLLTIDLGPAAPDLQGRRLRGRLDGQRVLPYWSRAELADNGRLRGHELLWVDDAIEAFFLQVQGSGRVQLPDGAQVRVGYADTNGHPYRSIGRWLIERGELTFEQASMQGIQAWARANPQRLLELLNQNPSYIFFRELPLGDPAAGPVGALGVALTPEVSVAVDPQFVPLGAPVVLATEHPSTRAPLRRLMLAQDTGSAIRGPLRFDYFWGFGAQAGEHAGRQRHDAAAWLLVPRGLTPEALLALQ